MKVANVLRSFKITNSISLRILFHFCELASSESCKHSLEEEEEVSKEATKEINHDDLEDESQFTSLNRSL